MTITSFMSVATFESLYTLSTRLLYISLTPEYIFSTNK